MHIPQVVAAIRPSSHDLVAVNISQQCGSWAFSKPGAMGLQWTWAEAVASLEQKGLALCAEQPW